MTKERWATVKSIFERCLPLDSVERQRVLSSQQLDSDTCALVERLLRNAEELPDHFLSPPLVAHRILSRELLSPGDLLCARWAIQNLLGRGGMGEVYRALDRELGEMVALKVISRDFIAEPQAAIRFRRELQLARQVTHFNVCRVFEINRHQSEGDAIDFITMELLEGVTLAAEIKTRTSFTPEQAYPLVKQILAGLGAAHAAGIIHRDLKPHNIMLARGSDQCPRVVLMDFGLARSQSGLRPTEGTTQGGLMGTLDYMAPEQLTGANVTAQTDIYAIGLIFYEMLTGVKPFASDPQSLGPLQRLHMPAPDPSRLCSTIPRFWSQTILKCLECDPARRPASVDGILLSLEGKSTAAQARPWRASRKMPRRAFAVSAGAGLIAASYYFWRSAHRAFPEGVGLIVADAAGPDAKTAAAISFQVARTLGQSDHLHLADRSMLEQAWRLMGRSGPVQPEDARGWREIAARSGVPLLLFLSLARVGDGLAVAFRLEHVGANPETPNRFWQRAFEAPHSAELFHALDLGCRWAREIAGETVGRIALSSSPPESVTTPSWPALAEFSRGEKLAEAGDRNGALFAFDAALRFDPDFTIAWMRKGDVAVGLGREQEGYAAWQRAVETSGRRPLTRREDLRFRSMLASDGGDYTAAEKLFKEYSYYFPAEWYGPFFRSLPLLLIGRAEEAIAELERCLSFPDRRGRAHAQLAWAYLYKGDRAGAEQHARELRRSGLDSLAAWAEMSIAHYYDETGRALELLLEASRDVKLMRDSVAGVYRCTILADAGRAPEAIEGALRSAVGDLSDGYYDQHAWKLISAANLLLRGKQGAEAVKVIRRLQTERLGPRHSGYAGAILARCGALDEAKKLFVNMPSSIGFPRFLIPRFRLEGEIALARRRIGPALELFRRAAALEPKAYGQEYLAYGLSRGGRRAEALAEYTACLKVKSISLRLITPEPAGQWRHAADAIVALKN